MTSTPYERRGQVARDDRTVAGPAGAGTRPGGGQDPVPHPRSEGTPAGERDVVLPGPIDRARAALVLHRLDAESRCCSTCGGPSPCPAAREAAQVLVEAGAWHTVPTAPLLPRIPRVERPGRLRRLWRWLVGGSTSR